MAKTVVALYDSFSDAEQVRRDLVDEGFSQGAISLISHDVTGGDTLAGGDTTLVDRLTDMEVPWDEAEYYAEGVRRGGALVTVRAEDDEVDLAVDIMERYVSVDVEQRSAQWREGGWTGYDQDAAPYTTEGIDRERDLYAAGSADTGLTTDRDIAADYDTVSDRDVVADRDVATDYGATADRGATTDRYTVGAGDQETVEVVEEELQVGKRQVERGGVRVHTHVTERPVEEQVRLREEHATVERRPVDRPATEADLDAFREETIEVTETVEEPVVSKRARVVEEVVISKEISERTETVRDTVRRTDVDVEDLEGGQVRGGRDFEAYDADFRRDYETSFADRGYAYEDYAPAYRYGHDLATHDYYRGRNWEEIEPEARRDWEERNTGTWDEFKDAVRRGWERVTGRY